MAKKIMICFCGFTVGFAFCFCLSNMPKNNELWMNPDTGYLVWTNKAPSGEYISIDKESNKAKENNNGKEKSSSTS